MDLRANRSPLKGAPLREPGQSIRNATVDLVFRQLLPMMWITSLACVLTVLTRVEQGLGWHVSTQACALVTLASATACALQLYFMSDRVEALQLGRDGELAVGQFLEQQLIPHGARIVHDVQADGFNLDHVVIALQGVFVIETKTRTKPHHREARVTFAEDGLRIAGYKPDRDPIRQVVASSRWLSELLTDSTGQSIQARGVIVFPGWYIEPMTRDWLNGGHPWVLEPKSIRSFFVREPAVLGEREVAMFANHLTRYVRGRENAERKK